MRLQINVPLRHVPVQACRMDSSPGRLCWTPLDISAWTSLLGPRSPPGFKVLVWPVSMLLKASSASLSRLTPPVCSGAAEEKLLLLLQRWESHSQLRGGNEGPRRIWFQALTAG